MEVSNRKANELLRNEWVENLIAGISATENEVMKTKSNTIAIPVIDCNDVEKWIVITVQVPTGADKGREPYDGYAEAEDYQHKLKEAELKKKKREEEKQKKIEHDKKMREKKSAE